MTRNDTPIQWASYLLAAAGLLTMLLLHLVPAVLAGLLVYVLVGGITRRYLGAFDNRKARVWVTAAVALIIGLAIVAAVSLLLSQLQVSSMQGLTGLWNKIADIVAGARDILPAWMLDNMPNSAEDIQAEVVGLLKAHTGQLQTIGKEMGIGLLHTLIGSIIGGLVVVSQVSGGLPAKPLHAALTARATQLALSFERVFLGQGKIALINATGTAIYLVLALPLFGIHLPFVKTIVLLTLVMGFIPVLGNLVSNFVIVVVSASNGFGAALASLAFLVLLHKAEYFLAARILGAQINARAWELLMAMLVMEAAFGVPGVVTAPMIYAYLKAELSEQQLV